jgi:hypothetical protein
VLLAEGPARDLQGLSKHRFGFCILTLLAERIGQLVVEAYGVGVILKELQQLLPAELVDETIETTASLLHDAFVVKKYASN